MSGPTEHQMQAEVIRWARMRCNSGKVNLLFSIPNAGKRTVITGRRMRNEGLLAGMPDLCLPVPRVRFLESHRVQVFGALYIEMKSAKGKLSEHQAKMIEILQAAGNRVVVCRSAAEAIAEIERYLFAAEPIDEA